MSVQIYYFSGTGNCLHVARELRARLPDTTLAPVISALREERPTSTAGAVGVVFPIHAFHMPATVRQFLERADLASASYLFAIATRFCSDKVFDDMDRILARQGKSLDATFAVEMPCTYTPIFEIPSQEELQGMAAGLQQDLDAIAALVAGGETSRVKDSALVYVLGHVLYPPITAWYQRVRFPDMEGSFYANSDCGDCGLCERVCLSEKIRLGDDGPEWQEDIQCTYCFACLHWCPSQAIQLRGRKTDEKARYHHPQISAADIAAQKD